MIAITTTEDWKKAEEELNRVINSGIRESFKNIAHEWGRMLVRKVREEIESFPSKYPNAALTVFIKGANTPLEETGRMVEALDYTVSGNQHGSYLHIGIPDSAGTVGRANPQYNILLSELASLQHDGFSSPVTKATRSYFKSAFQIVLSPGTKVMVIPPRPFMDNVTESDSVSRAMEEIFDVAMGMLENEGF